MLRRVIFGVMLAVLMAALIGSVSEAQQPTTATPQGPSAPLFQTSDTCLACHNGLTSPSGEDISIGFDWRATMMANASRDPYWHAGVRRETLDHPQARAVIEDECSICHMPMAHYETKAQGREAEVFAHLPINQDTELNRLAADGVSCTTCHQIENQRLGTRESFVGRFVVAPAMAIGERRIYGPYQIDAGRTRIMRSATRLSPTEGTHIQQSELCATCHTLYTTALGPDGQAIGELPEQVPYQEWFHSAYRQEKSCQACHMPAVADVPITSVLGDARPNLARHTFVGGNFFMLSLLNRYRNELGVAALPQELTASVNRTIAHLQRETARVSIVRAEQNAGRITVDLSVQNLGGHKLPTAYPSRRVWLHLVVRDGNGRVVFESGAINPQGAIQGNDNDADATRYEPHYSEITSGDQVQIYESMMAGPNGALTTGLLTAVRFVKDNRLLPRGFDKETAGADIAVIGEAREDRDFTDAGDTVRYAVPLNGAEGPLQIEAELWFQPISFRWADNLRQYNSAETRRFNAYYDSMASSSAVVLARASAVR
jgi:hypothetical protein